MESDSKNSITSPSSSKNDDVSNDIKNAESDNSATVKNKEQTKKNAASKIKEITEKLMKPKKNETASKPAASPPVANGYKHVSYKTTCPFNSSDWKKAGIQPLSSTRVKKDIASLYMQPMPGIFFVPDEEDLMCVNAMIVGNFDTPYEGGFFHFYIRFGPRYPFEPPRVCIQSCSRFGEKVRFNPNMYENGTVCLSILGTWHGPSWTAANNLSGLLLSIQSLFCDEALCNEPGYDERRKTGDKHVWVYDLYVLHETLRVAVVHTVKNAEKLGIPEELIQVMRSAFLEYYDQYIKSCEENMVYDGTQYQVPLRSSCTFVPSFKTIKGTLVELHGLITRLNVVPSNSIKVVPVQNDQSNESTSQKDSAKSQPSGQSEKAEGSAAKKMNVSVTTVLNSLKQIGSAKKDKPVNTKMASSIHVKSPVCEKIIESTSISLNPPAHETLEDPFLIDDLSDSYVLDVYSEEESDGSDDEPANMSVDNAGSNDTEMDIEKGSSTPASHPTDN